MNEFLTFLFNEDILRENLRPGWIKLYDFKYIDNDIIEYLLQLKIKLKDLLDFILKKAKVGNIENKDLIDEKNEKKSEKNENEIIKINENNKFSLPEINKTTQPSSKQISIKKRPQSAKKITIPKPFNLSENKPIKLQEPNLNFNTNFIAKPVPIEKYKKTSLKELEEKRKKNLEENKNKKPNFQPFNFKSDKKSNIDKIKEEVEKELQSKLKFNQKYHNPPKDYSKIPADVKYNETAIIKEEFLLEKKKKEEEKALNKILIEKKDIKEYERWISEMKLKDDLIKMEEVQKRKIELDLNREVAQNYFIRRTKINQLKALEHKQQEMINEKNRNEERKKEIEEKKIIAKEIYKDYEKVIEVRNKLIENNKELYKNRKEEFNYLNLLSKEEKKIELEKRDEIIRQIRELEKIPLKRNTGFDPSETPGYGLLNELSLVELKERLEIQKKMNNELIIAKREENKLLNKEKNDNLIEKANKIALNRDQLRNKKEIEKKIKKDNLKEKEILIQKIREKSLNEVKEKIENKKNKLRKEDEIFDKKIREIKLQRQFLQQGSAVVEEKQFKMFEDGLERKINDRQNQLLIDQEKKEVVQWKNLKQRYQSARIDVRKQREKLLNYQNDYLKNKNLNDLIVNEDNIFVKAIHDKEIAMRNFFKDNIKEKNKFSHNLKNNTFKKKRVQSARNKIVKKNSEFNTFDNEKLNQNNSEKKITVNENLSDNEENPILNKLENENVNDEKNKEAIPG